MGKYLTEEKSTKLMSDLLSAFGITFSAYPLFTSECILYPLKGTRFSEHIIIANFSIEDYSDKKNAIDIPSNISSKELKHISTTEDYIETNFYSVFIGNRTFQIFIYDTPDDLGYHSVLPNYDYESYLCANIRELREDKSQKSEAVFGFDIEKMEFLELFELFSINKIGHRRDLQNINAMEKIFYGRKLN